jgi:histidinol dehydrogenase
MKIYKYPAREEWAEIISRPVFKKADLFQQVTGILERVKAEGDEGVRHYTLQYDGVDIPDPAVPHEWISEASLQVKEELKKAINTARGNIIKFHAAQQIIYRDIMTSPGVKCWQRAEPIEKVGLYIPGGSAPLVSTVLMLGIPAVVAGCREIILCTPPDKNGRVNPAILYTAGLLGINNIFRIGGAQAIGAMAYGTKTVPSVYKIFGPGNQYVTLAKQMVAVEGVAIDLPAGPSEIAIMADQTANPEFIASDLLSQAEHGTDSQVLLVTTHEPLLNSVANQLDIQLEKIPRKEIARESLKQSRLVLLNSTEEMLELMNAYAPEHLTIMIENYNSITGKIRNAGSVFLGPYSPESAGDYASGTNHTLPTNGYARAYSGIGLESFRKVISFQEISRYGLFNLSPAIVQFAEAENLLAHKNAVAVRLGQQETDSKLYESV